MTDIRPGDEAVAAGASSMVSTVADEQRYPREYSARAPDCNFIYGLPMMCRWAERVPAHIIYAPVSL
jgi:hypothetical protein